MSALKRPPSPRFHLLHGDDEVAIEKAKTAIIDANLDPEMREENFREVLTNPGTPLKRVMDDIMGELATVSFLPDSPRVVVVYTVSDLIDGGKAKTSKAKSAKAATESTARSSSEILAEFVEQDMPNLDAVLIMIAIEDPEKWKKLNFDNPLVQIAARIGTLKGFRDESPQFAFFDALFDRQQEKALRLWREWLQRSGSGNPRPYQMLSSQMRLLIQAKILAAGTYGSRGMSRAEFVETCLPPETDRSVARIQPEFRRDKLARQSQNFSFQELNRAYLRLLPIMKYIIPVSTDVTVPDKSILGEVWILDLILGRLENAA
jgi:DNA polymerase III delta subunit